MHTLSQGIPNLHISIWANSGNASMQYCEKDRRKRFRELINAYMKNR
ncbi:hypothetical protein BBCT_0484 [Bifidobacterium catenulatum DSM 16992 = JCM 1194 = LMG 11043]|uniref:Uncharacterized protein n=2 Tax=Bifidobacterium catenulatum DSM 16992 = JCM 1194 = LMG 11043 TaxID=566552 RepID=B6XX97_9BIFI|nr:hypothetical protein BIFCAT_01769 [Bifidobacterium catenulatum DSM 16992 = JCM 1194 = LMG 11043]BAR01452.1 hypothetical protein BBCT_0484 [Bifidobacterium catenulatum DSM 16992 = JCM 1194 = LMG 11043]